MDVQCKSSGMKDSTTRHKLVWTFTICYKQGNNMCSRNSVANDQCKTILFSIIKVFDAVHISLRKRVL